MDDKFAPLKVVRRPKSQTDGSPWCRRQSSAAAASRRKWKPSSGRAGWIDRSRAREAARRYIDAMIEVLLHQAVRRLIRHSANLIPATADAFFSFVTPLRSLHRCRDSWAHPAAVKYPPGAVNYLRGGNNPERARKLMRIPLL